jgi:hypothetical protein
MLNLSSRGDPKMTESEEIIIKDIIANSLSWYKGSIIDDTFINKVSEEIRDVLKAKKVYEKPN